MKTVSVYYYNPNNIKNFGDIINPLIISDIFNIPTTLGTIKTADLIGIGSILQEFLKQEPTISEKIKKQFRKNLYVWGTGLICPPPESSFIRRRLCVHALRGKLTQKILSEKLRSNLDHITLGDPGLLACRLLKEPPEKKFKVGIIPHYVDQDSPALESLKALHPASTIIQILGDPLKTLEKIAECEIILSSAMHGLIAADSLNIPNQWIRFSDKLTGGNFKFYDYYSVFDLSPQCWDITRQTISASEILEIPKRYKVAPEKVKIIQEELISSFPFRN